MPGVPLAIDQSWKGLRLRNVHDAMPDDATRAGQPRRLEVRCMMVRRRVDMS